MSIVFDSEKKVFLLNTPKTSYAIGINEYGYLLHLYYGAKIDDTDIMSLSFITVHSSMHARQEMTGKFFSKDLNMMEIPCSLTGDLRPTALSIRRRTGTNDTDLVFDSYHIEKGKPKLKGLPATYAKEEEATTLSIICKDIVSGAEVTLLYTVFEKIDAITRTIFVKNTSATSFVLENVCSCSVDLPCGDQYDIIHLPGDWAEERLAERVPVMHGLMGVYSHRGASSPIHNPFLALCDHKADEEHGSCYGFNFVYSGNFEALCDLNIDDTLRVLMGMDKETFCWEVKPGETFICPETVMVYSNDGIGEMSRTFHRLYRNHLIRGKWQNEKRPLLINNWESMTFNFDEEKVYAFAKQAKELGVEMVVLDDGWFGTRNTDKSGLGDWFVNENKLHGGLGKLVERIHQLGLKFGLWFEPEMVSKDSELFRKHPEWALQCENRHMSIARHQYVLDMGRQDVQDYLFDCINNILKNADINYIKWDYNRCFSEQGSGVLDANHQGEVCHRFILGLYALLERLQKSYPDVLFEGCSSGGGRFDAGMLYYTPQIWTSDDTDAIERLYIQYGTSLCYPYSTMGAHVSEVPNKQTCRTTPFSTRGNVAMAGTFGYELDLNDISENEKEIVKEQCKDYHKYYQLTHYGDLYRLINPLPDRKASAWEFVSEDKTEAMVTYVLIRMQKGESHHLYLKGLDKDKKYYCEQLNRTWRGSTWMNAGFLIENRMKDFDSFVFYFKSV